jgi:hypothetical protein
MVEENDKPLTQREHQQSYGFDRQDRDLLIRLNTRVEDLIQSLAKKDDILAKDIGGLQQGKVDKSEMATHCANDAKDFQRLDEITDEHERKIESLTKYLWVGVGAIAVLQFLAPFIINKVF